MIGAGLGAEVWTRQIKQVTYPESFHKHPPEKHRETKRHRPKERAREAGAADIYLVDKQFLKGQLTLAWNMLLFSIK